MSTEEDQRRRRRQQQQQELPAEVLGAIEALRRDSAEGFGGARVASPTSADELCDHLMGVLLRNEEKCMAFFKRKKFNPYFLHP